MDIQDNNAIIVSCDCDNVGVRTGKYYGCVHFAKVAIREKGSLFTQLLKRANEAC